LGIKQNPGLLTLEKIGRGFGLDISELLAPNVSKKPLRAKTTSHVGTNRNQ